ncbi:uncharacterized protein BCR38DRAFT_413988 [Pseudomassariella vexata]|uniref:Uncharacterized protein n=1 Tax=Pseudomassariella vexata TaxID=1141098 RepID=A0A1Y2DCY0_9PEZI|nr:uncharacterized protein BCR38DRAFT_413988 [Pseudomassariella vexata]ORY57133.1 hypothetical protein BCR38DRAFT_413988 [Pseudomassariella vexata]
MTTQEVLEMENTTATPQKLPEGETLKYILASLIFTLFGLLFIVAIAAGQVRKQARHTIISGTRLVAFGVGYIVVGLVYIPVLLLDQAERNYTKRSWSGCQMPSSPPDRYSHSLSCSRNRNDSDVSDLDIGELRHCLERGKGIDANKRGL